MASIHSPIQSRIESRVKPLLISMAQTNNPSHRIKSRRIASDANHLGSKHNHAELRRMQTTFGSQAHSRLTIPESGQFKQTEVHLHSLHHLACHDPWTPVLDMNYCFSAFTSACLALPWLAALSNILSSRLLAFRQSAGQGLVSREKSNGRRCCFTGDCLIN